MIHPKPENAAVGRWWDEGINLVEGCTPVSAGCANCWHIAMAKRFGGDGKVRVREDRLPRLSKGAPRVKAIWGDLFHRLVSDENVERALVQMAVFGAKHTQIVLTKRPDRASRTVADWIARMPVDGPTRNIIFGTSAEDQPTLDERMPHILATPAVYRCVSLEPLLDEVDLSLWLDDCQACRKCGRIENADCYDVLGAKVGNVFCTHCNEEQPYNAPLGLDWVIVGAETGPKRRPCRLEWIIDVVQQCRNAGVPCWVKAVDLGKRVSHDPVEWPAELTRMGEMREWIGE